MPYKSKGKRTEPERVGDIRGEPATNVALDREKAVKMANLLEGLDFPTTKKRDSALHQEEDKSQKERRGC